MQWNYPEVDHYELLGLPPDAHRAEIEATYRNLIDSVHPERGGTGELYAYIHRAYETLIDPSLRKAYDEQRGTGGAPTPRWARWRRRPRRLALGRPAACPRCHLVVDPPHRDVVHCPGCGYFFVPTTQTLRPRRNTG